MITVTLADMNMWVAALLWPLTRILGLIAASPLWGSQAIPVSAKIVLGTLLALIMAPAIPALPALDPMSMAGLLIVLQELLIGLAMGFAMRIVFAAVEMAGEVSSLTMGLGFATFFDPQTQGRSSAISQFLALMATTVFIAGNVHLVLLEVLAESFISLPVAAAPISGGLPLALVRWGGTVFSAGLQLSLPIVAALLITNVALGILTRAAPQLNIFGIGFPISLGVGLLVISLTIPYWGGPLQRLLFEGIESSRNLPRAGLPVPARAGTPVRPLQAAPPALGPAQFR
jgi:flagellar biosynthetic protein FliR